MYTSIDDKGADTTIDVFSSIGADLVPIPDLDRGSYRQGVKLKLDPDLNKKNQHQHKS